MLKIGFRGQVVDTDRALLGHGCKLSLASNLRVRVSTLRIKIEFFFRLNLNELLVHLLLVGVVYGLCLICHCYYFNLLLIFQLLTQRFTRDLLTFWGFGGLEDWSIWDLRIG